MNEFFVISAPLPHTVNGLVLPTPEGDYQIVLNSRQSQEQQQAALKHEVAHILGGHFEQDWRGVKDLEQEAALRARLEDRILEAVQNGLSLPLPGARPANPACLSSPAEPLPRQAHALPWDAEPPAAPAPFPPQENEPSAAQAEELSTAAALRQLRDDLDALTEALYHEFYTRPARARAHRERLRESPPPEDPWST